MQTYAIDVECTHFDRMVVRNVVVLAGRNQGGNLWVVQDEWHIVNSVTKPHFGPVIGLGDCFKLLIAWLLAQEATDCTCVPPCVSIVQQPMASVAPSMVLLASREGVTFRLTALVFTSVSSLVMPHAHITLQVRGGPTAGMYYV